MKKHEKYKDCVVSYIQNHKDCYVREICKDLNLSFYVVKEILNRNNLEDLVNYGLSPRIKQERDKKISDTLINLHKEGFVFVDYNEEWKKRCKEGAYNKYLSNPEKVKNVTAKILATKRERYGQNLEAINEKISCALRKRYDSGDFSNIEKAKQTKLERYGDKNFNNKVKIRQTCQERYEGIGLASDLLKHKYQETMMEKYGVKHNFSSKDPKLNGRSTCKEKYGKDYYSLFQQKSQETRLHKYGDRFWSNSQKAQQTLLEKYGVKWGCLIPHVMDASHSKETQLKREETYRKNGFFVKSKMEEDYYKFLLQFYTEDDILRQYKDERYPFHCDFYIKSEDKFIECNFHWTHGPHPYDCTNQEDFTLAQCWLNKSNLIKMYKVAYYVWTDLDCRKLKVAQDNKLNYESIYYKEWEKYIHANL